ncbi:hypothetical protein [Wenyingzhuangia sp. IMCC45574]
MKKLTLIPFLVFALLISCGDDAKETFIPPVETPTDETPGNETPSECLITNKDGLLIIEAESFDLNGSWRLLEDEKASGGKYIEYYGANSYASYVNQGAHEISVKFYVDKESNYLFRWFMRQDPHEEGGDLSNDVWLYFPGNLSRANIDGSPYTLTHFEKFVSRSENNDFIYGGALDLHEPKKSSSWMRVVFPAAGEYTLKIRGRSKGFQLDKIIMSTGIPDTDVKTMSKTLTEVKTCDN